MCRLSIELIDLYSDMLQNHMIIVLLKNLFLRFVINIFENKHFTKLLDRSLE